jgi:hypothetical protein
MEITKFLLACIRVNVLAAISVAEDQRRKEGRKEGRNKQTNFMKQSYS